MRHVVMIGILCRAFPWDVLDGMMNGMATRKVTLSLDETAWSFAEQAAARAGVSPSAWISRAARREAVRTGLTAVPDPVEIAMADEAERLAAEAAIRAEG